MTLFVQPSQVELSDRPPVVILGANEMALAAARSLHGRHGVRAISLDTAQRRPPASYSRHLEWRRGPREGDHSALCDSLTQLADELDAQAVLLPVHDWAVSFVYRFRSELEQRYRLCIWDSELLLALGSKRRFAAVAARYSLPVPGTVTPHGRVDLERAIGTLSFPVVVKPEFTSQWWSAPAVELGLGHKALVARDPTCLRDICDRSERVGAKVVIQSLIEGRDSDHFSYGAFVTNDGVTTAEIVVRKLRIHPPGFGIGSYVVSVNDEEAKELGRTTLARLGLRGFASVQLKRDDTGRLHIFEIGLRFPMWTELATSAGVDFPLAYYQASLGEAYTSPKPTAGRAWMSLRADWRSMRTYARTREWRWWQWGVQAIARPAHPLFRWDDPAPGAVAMAQWALAGAVRRLSLGRAALSSADATATRLSGSR